MGKKILIGFFLAMLGLVSFCVGIALEITKSSVPGVWKGIMILGGFLVIVIGISLIREKYLFNKKGKA